MSLDAKAYQKRHQRVPERICSWLYEGRLVLYEGNFTSPSLNENNFNFSIDLEINFIVLVRHVADVVKKKTSFLWLHRISFSSSWLEKSTLHWPERQWWLNTKPVHRERTNDASRLPTLYVLFCYEFTKRNKNMELGDKRRSTHKRHAVATPTADKRKRAGVRRQVH